MHIHTHIRAATVNTLSFGQKGFCRKLHENERNWIERGEGARVSNASLRSANVRQRHHSVRDSLPLITNIRQVKIRTSLLHHFVDSPLCPVEMTASSANPPGKFKLQSASLMELIRVSNSFDVNIVFLNKQPTHTQTALTKIEGASEIGVPIRDRK